MESVVNLVIKLERDNEDIQVFVETFNVAAHVSSPEIALRSAVNDFITSNSEEAKRALNGACGSYNWGDAMSSVSDEYFEKHGLKRLHMTSTDIFVDHDEILQTNIGAGRMNKDKFWQIIDSAREKAGHWKGMYDPLLEALSKHEIPDIIRWYQIFDEYYQLSYKDKLWAAAAIMHNGCSDDSFDYFRGWLIAQGKSVFLNSLANPDSLADVETVQVFGREVLDLEYTPLEGYHESARFEGIASVAVEAAYARKIDYNEDFYGTVAKEPLPDRDKADIVREIVYAKDIDAKWGEINTPWLETLETLKNMLPNLYRTFHED